MENEEIGDGDRQIERVLLFCRSESEFYSLDNANATALISLVDHLLETTNNIYSLKCMVKHGQIICLKVFGNSDVKFEVLKPGASFRFHTSDIVYSGGTFCRSHLDNFDVSASHVQIPVAFRNLESMSLHMDMQAFGPISSWMANKILPSMGNLEIGDRLLHAASMNFDPFLSWLTHKNLPILRCISVRRNGRSRSFAHFWVVREFISKGFIRLKTKDGRILSFLQYIDRTFPSIDDNASSIEIENALALLGRIDFTLCQRLKSLRISMEYKMRGVHLKTLFIEILPKMPNVSNISFATGNIPNLEEFFEELIRLKIATPTITNAVSLQVEGLPILQSVHWRNPSVYSPISHATILKFLETFNTIYSFGYVWDTDGTSTLPPDIMYAMLKNLVGRRLVESNGHGDENNDNESKACIPAALWPKVLERVQSGVYPYYYRHLPEGSKATGIYYLLREGPVLRDRHSMVQGIGRKQMKTGDENNSNADNNE